MDYLLYLHKAENPEQYAKLANEGVLLGYPVKINGQSHRPDNNIAYHSTIKYFDPSKDHPHVVHSMARHMPLGAPDAKNTQIKFDKFKDRLGNDVHVVTLHGNSADKIKEQNGKFAHMGFPATFEWTPHISVDKNTWDKLQSSGAKTAHEAGISFGPAVLKKGPKVLKTYHHEADSAEPKVPDLSDMTAKVVAKSESNWSTKPYGGGMDSHHFEKQGHKISITPMNQGGHRVELKTPKGENHMVEVTGGIHHAKGHAISMLADHLGVQKSEKPLEKGALKNAGIALGMAGALANSSAAQAPKAPQAPHSPSRSPASIQEKAAISPYDHKKMLNALSMTESSGGKNIEHKPLSNGEHAYGKYALRAGTIKDTIKNNPDLRAKHSKVLALNGDQVNKYMQDNRGLEDVVADRHLAHLERHFGQNPEVLGFSWLNGVTGTNKAKNKGFNFSKHWYSQKVKHAYEGK